jgi:phosphatidylglycerophosphatase A
LAKSFTDNIVLFIATGTNLGNSRFAPGTLGTLWGLPLAFAINKAGLQSGALILAASIIIAIIISSRAAILIGKKDPGSVVADEIVGFAVTIFAVPFTPVNVILAFILFRIFDILKPPPISYLDRNVKGGLGIVVDDLAAGVMAAIVLNIIIRFVL